MTCLRIRQFVSEKMMPAAAPNLTCCIQLPRLDAAILRGGVRTSLPGILHPPYEAMTFVTRLPPISVVLTEPILWYIIKVVTKRKRKRSSLYSH